MKIVKAVLPSLEVLRMLFQVYMDADTQASCGMGEEGGLGNHWLCARSLYCHCSWTVGGWEKS